MAKIYEILSTDQQKAQKPDDFYLLAMPDSKRTDLEVMQLVDAVVRMFFVKGIRLPMPNEVAESIGESCITVDEYLSNLKDLGFDVVDLLAYADEIRSEFESLRRKNTDKAAAFFELIRTEWIIEDADVKKYIDSESIYDLLQLVLDHADSTRARLKAIKMHAKDPKQADKVLVRECWDDWQKQPDRYKGKASFARDMRDKFPNLESQPVIEGWCRVWAKES
jgi:hypothetical protein